MLDVIRMHRDAIRGSSRTMCSRSYFWPRRSPGTPRCSTAKNSANKNSQVTVLAPHRNHRLHDGLRHHRNRADLALVKHKKLVGGGLIKIVNNTVPEALLKLGYTPDSRARSFRTSTSKEPWKARRT